MQFDPNRAQPPAVRCTETRAHQGPCRYHIEDALEWAEMPNMDSYRCDYEIVRPVSDGTWLGLREGRHE